MPKKYRPITQDEKIKQICIGLLVAFIYAAFIGFIAPFLFQWVAGFFDPAPNAPRACEYSEFREKPFGAYQACKDQSDSYPIRMERLSRTIPWFWISFVFFGWTWLRNPLRGRTRDDSGDIVYDGQMAWYIFLDIIVQVSLYVTIWALIARDKLSFTALGICASLIVFWLFLHKWFLNKFGEQKSERQS